MPKEVRPLPFSYSLGLDAIYDFELRGSDGQLHRQMVPAAVFANYEVGDYFSEFQPPARVERAPFLPDFWPPARPLEDQGTRYPMQVPLPPDPASR